MKVSSHLGELLYLYVAIGLFFSLFAIEDRFWQFMFLLFWPFVLLYFLYQNLSLQPKLKKKKRKINKEKVEG